MKSFVFAPQQLCLPTCDSSRCWWIRGLGCSLKFWGGVWSWHLTAKHRGNKKISPQELTIALSAEHSESAPLISQQRQATRRSCMRSWTCSCLSCVRSLPVAVQPGTWRKDMRDRVVFFAILLITLQLCPLFSYQVIVRSALCSPYNDYGMMITCIL